MVQCLMQDVDIDYFSFCFLIAAHFRSQTSKLANLNKFSIFLGSSPSTLLTKLLSFVCVVNSLPALSTLAFVTICSLMEQKLVLFKGVFSK